MTDCIIFQKSPKKNKMAYILLLQAKKSEKQEIK